MEVSHQRLLVSASPRIGDTIWAPQRGPRTQRHPYKGEREVQPSCRNWSRWSSGRDHPGEQKNYPHSSLVLLYRRPPCARESWCLRARLPPWRDVAAERPALGLLHADPSLLSPYKLRPTFPANYVPRFLHYTLEILQCNSRQYLCVLGNRAIALLDSLTLLPWHNRVTSTSRTLVC